MWDLMHCLQNGDKWKTKFFISLYNFYEMFRTQQHVSRQVLKCLNWVKATEVCRGVTSVLLKNTVMTQ